MADITAEFESALSGKQTNQTMDLTAEFEKQLSGETEPEETSWWGAVKVAPALAASGLVRSGAGVADIVGRSDIANKLRQDADIVDKQVDIEEHVNPNSWKGAGRSAATSLTMQAPALALGALTGGATIPLTAMGLQAGTQKVSDLVEGGVTKAKAIPLGVLSGGIEAGTELVPFGSFLKILKGNKGVAANVVKMLISEQLGEQAATLGDTVIDLVKPDASWNWDQYKDAVVATAKATALQSGTMAAGGVAGRRITSKFNKPTVPTEGSKDVTAEFENQIKDGALPETVLSDKMKGVKKSAQTKAAKTMKELVADQTEKVNFETLVQEQKEEEAEGVVKDGEVTPEPPSVQKLNKAGGLTEEELLKLSGEKVEGGAPLYDTEQLDALQKLPGFKQREQYNRIYPPTIEVPADTVTQTKLADIDNYVKNNSAVYMSKAKDVRLLRKAGWKDEAIAAMKPIEVEEAANNLRGEINTVNPAKETIAKLSELQVKTQELKDKFGDRTPDELSDEELISYTSLYDEVSILEIKELAQEEHWTTSKLNREIDLYKNEHREVLTEESEAPVTVTTPTVAPPNAGKARRESAGKKLKTAKYTPEEQDEIARLAASQDEDIIQQDPNQISIEELERIESGENPFEGERGPRALDFNEYSKVPKYTHFDDRNEELFKGSMDAKNKFYIHIERALSRIKEFTTSSLRNLVVLGDKYFPLEYEEAKAHFDKQFKLETLAESNLPYAKRTAYTLKMIAKDQSTGAIPDKIATVMRIVYRTLKVHPNFDSYLDKTLPADTDGLYTFCENILRIKNTNHLMHEVYHWAWHNILTAADRNTYRQNFLNKYYDNGYINFKKMRITTSDSWNAVGGVHELFACQGSDYMVDKVLNNDEKTVLMKVATWFREVVALMRRRVGVDLQGVEHLFQKIADDKYRRETLNELQEGVRGVTPWIKSVDFSDFSKKSYNSLTHNLSNLIDRITYLKDIFAKANKNPAGRNILAEIKGGNLGEPGETLTSKPIISVNDEPLSERIHRNLGQFFISPMKFVEGTRNERHVYNFNLGEMFVGFQYDQHRTTIDNIQIALVKAGGNPENVRLVVEGKIEGTEAEKVAAQQVREWLDIMKNKYKLWMINQYKANLKKAEYGALLDINAGMSEEEVVARYPNVNAKVIKSINEKYQEIDTWGLDDYIPNVESGRFKLLVDVIDPEGKVHKKLVAIGLSVPDAIRKGTAYLSDPKNAGVTQLFLDTDYKMISDDKTAITRNQYYGMMNKLAKKMEGSLDTITKEVAKSLAKTAMNKQFKITPTNSYSPFLQERQDILQGEADIFPVLRSYAHSMEKKMALDPMIEKVRKDLPKMNKYERAYILDYVEDVKGRYGAADRILDDIMIGFANTGFARRLGLKVSANRTYSNIVAKTRTLEAKLKLGYRPVAAGINFASGQMHTWVKRGAPMYLDGIKFLRTEEGKKFAESIEPFLGTSIAVEAGKDIRPKEKLWHALGLFQMPEPYNRLVSASAAYIQAKKEGMSELAATEFAIRANWAEQFTYNIANLPKIMRGPTGKLLTQFKPYLVKEIEFISTLTGKEWVRYAGMQLALGGPRGYMLILKSLPVLAMMGWWNDAMDWVEEMMNKYAPLASRGVMGLPGVIDQSLASDVSAAATFQFPRGLWDFAGPALNDLGKIYQNVITPLLSFGPDVNDLEKMGDIVPILKHWSRIMSYAFSEDDWVKDDKGNRLYEVEHAVPFIVQSLAGMENVDINMIKAEQRILAARDERIGGIKTRILNDAMQEVIDGKGISEETRMKMQKEGVTTQSLINRVKKSKLTPRQRAIVNTEIRRRMAVSLDFPVKPPDYLNEPEPLE